MTPQQLKVIQLYRPLLETLAESDDFGGIPESLAFIGYDGLLSLDSFQKMLSGLKTTKVINITHHLITKGESFETYLNAFKPIYSKLDAIKNERKN